MMPGAAGLPAAEAEVPVSAPMAVYIAGLPRRTLLAIRLVLRALEWLPFPWRFSRLGVDAREDFLARMETSGFGPYRDLVLLIKVLTTIPYGSDRRVWEVVGYEARCGLRDGASPPEPGPLGELGPPDGGEECDVVIVGSGAGGAAAAATLAEAGLDVVVLEAGDHHTRANYPDDPLGSLHALYRDGGFTLAEGRPMIPLPIGRAVGGTTVINSGTCFRAPEEVLRRWRDEHGVDWATDLEAEFDEAEEFLAVTPVDPERMGRNGQLCMEGAAAIGASGGPIRRNAGDCVQCSSCPFGCRLDAKRGMHVSYLPRAVAAGARVRAGVEARRVLIEGGRATGVECTVEGTGERPPRPFAVRARAVIAAGGAIGTPELLLRSGISGGGLVGRNLHVHPACWVGARYDEDVRGWDGVMQSYYVDEWHDRGLLLEATFTPLAFGAQWLAGVGRAHQERVRRYDRVGSIGVHLSDRSAGRVGIGGGGATRITYRLTSDDADRLVYGIARAAEIHLAAGALEVYPQIGGVPQIRPGRLADFEAARFKPARLHLEAFHPMGTAPMGSDPGRSVVGADGAVHGIEDLHVADASLFPTSVGVNPMITIIAFSTHVARGLAQSLAG